MPNGSRRRRQRLCRFEETFDAGATLRLPPFRSSQASCRPSFAESRPVGTSSLYVISMAISAAIINHGIHKNPGGGQNQAALTVAHAKYQRFRSELANRCGFERPGRKLLLDGKPRQQGAERADACHFLHKRQRIRHAKCLRLKFMPGEETVGLLPQSERRLGLNQRKTGEFAERDDLASRQRVSG